jgi:DNA-binding response OmpR family regulator
VSARILLVEDEPALLAILKAAVAFGGFSSEAVSRGRDAVEALSAGAFDAVLLDLGLPDIEGAEILPALRRMTAAPIIVVSGRGSEKDKIDALDLGADDYVAKPFLPGELLARIRAALRRAAATRTQQAPSLSPERGQTPTHTGGGPETFGALSMDPLSRAVTLGGVSATLNGAEYRVLRLLAARAGTTVSRADLLHDLYGAETPGESNVVDVYISRIRGKLRRLPDGEDLIANVRGQGWRLRLPG